MKKLAAFLLVCLLICSAFGQAEEKYRTLRYGCTGDDVLNLQVRLTELGYYSFKL